MKPRLLVLTAGFGEGHNAAARALAAACIAEHGSGSARVVDVFDLAAPRLNAVIRRSYLGLINRAPKLWSACYAWLDRSAMITRVLPATLRRETKILADVIATDAPAAICSTYPVYAFLLGKLAANGVRLPPHYNVVTDSISINSLWWRAGCAGWFLPNEDSLEVVRQAGVDPARLHVSGFPVTSFFSENAGRYAPPDLATLPPLSAPPASPRVLYIINSGTKDAAATARLLLAQPHWEVTCAVGRDEALLRELLPLTAYRGRPAQILGWTDQIPRLMMTHHVVVSKAGGATTQEAINARCPMIVNQIVPGQEEGNYELLRRHGVGALAETPDAVVTELYHAFANRGRRWRQWRDGLASLARVDAAPHIVAHVLGAVSTPPLAAPEPIPLPLRAAPAA